MLSIPILATPNDYFEVLPYEDNYNNAYISQSGDLIPYPSGGFRVYFYKAKKGDFFKLTGRGISSIALDYVVYNSDESGFSAATIAQKGEIIPKDDFNTIIEITSPDAVYLAVTWNFAMSLTISMKKQGSADEFTLRSIRSKAGFSLNDTYYGASSQEEVVHHDNFKRKPNEPKSWIIGSNDPSGKTMAYGYINGIEPKYDDGFRIRDGILTNDINVSVGSAFRVISAYKLLDKDFNIDISPIIGVGSHCHIAFNIVDEKTFDLFDISSDNKTPVVINVARVVKGKKTAIGTLNVKEKCERVRFHQTATGCSVITDNDIKASSINISINPSLPIALHITNREKYECRFIVLSNTRDLNCYSSHNNETGYFFSQSPAPSLPYSYRIGILEIVKTISKRLPAKTNYEVGDLILNSRDSYFYINSGNRWEKKSYSG